MRITTLIENLVYKSGLIAEHGLSFYIETEHKKILFDTGQSGAFLSNAQKLGIDISNVDCLILSHGHYDHTGGVASFVQQNSKAKIYLKREALLPKYHGPKKNIGFQTPLHLIENRIHYLEDRIEVDSGVYIMPRTTIVNSMDTAFHNFQVKTLDTFVEDTFEDELFLAIVKNNKLSVISSCSHRGITNMVTEAMESFSKSPVNLILGGFHLKEDNLGQYPEIVKFLNRIKPESIGVCHCTGIEMFARLKNDYSGEVFYSYTGSCINL